MPNVACFNKCFVGHACPPDWSGFITLREAPVEIFKGIVERHLIDRLVFVQMQKELPQLASTLELLSARLHNGDINCVQDARPPSGAAATEWPPVSWYRTPGRTHSNSNSRFAARSDVFPDWS